MPPGTLILAPSVTYHIQGSGTASYRDRYTREPKENVPYNIDELVTIQSVDFNVRYGDLNTPPTPLDSPAFQEPLPGHWGTTKVIDPSGFDFVAAKSAELVSPDDTPLERARKIFLFIREEIEYDPAEIRASSHRETLEIVLREKRANCAPQSLLFVVLCRTNPVPIPARVVCGQFVSYDGRVSTHHWVEFYLEGIGWIPADLTLASSEPLFWFGHTDVRHLPTRAISQLPSGLDHLWQLSSYRLQVVP